MNWLIARLSRIETAALVGGLSLIAVGAVCLWVASDYRVGQLNRFGPGFFPIVVSSILIAFGIAIIFENQAVEPDFRPTPLRSVALVGFAVLAFGLIVRSLGAVPATVAMVLVASLAQDKLRPVTAVAIAVVASLVMYVLFIRLLRLPIAAFPWS